MNRALVATVGTGVLVIAGLIIGVVFLASSRNKEKVGEAVCFTNECSETAHKILRNMDWNVKPCDNFYKFACGEFINSAPIPDGEISVNALSLIGNDIQDQLRTSIEEPSSADEPRPITLAKTLYWTCMNTTTIENSGLEPLRNIHRELGKWPVVEGDKWNENNFNWVEAAHKSRKLGYYMNYFFSLTMSVDWRNNKRYVLVLDQPGFGLGREYLIEGEKYFVVKAYYDFMVDVAVILGADRQRATGELKAALRFEMKLANISLSDEDRRNYTLLNNPMTVADLGRKYPSVNWVEYINNMLPSGTHVDANEVVDVRQPRFITELEKLMRITPKRVQANYALWRITAESVKYLTKNMRKREKEYYSAMTNNLVSADNPQWKDCLTIVSDSSLSLATSALYVRKYFKEEARQNVVEMVDDIQRELLKILDKADWMDEKTKSMARGKASSMLSQVAYPVELLDDKKLEQVYANLTVNPNDYFGSMLNLKKMDADFVLEMLRKPVNKSDWITHDHSTEVNAFYDPSENSINLPASVLQGIFFSNDRPRYMNYGAIGYLIGHECSHSFDSEGRQFDKDGNLVDWWTPETEQKFLHKAQCIINQYSNYTVESVGLNVDGENTLGENIADNGGVKNAYLAYKEYVRRNGPEPKLPGLDYTPEQMFWISAANVWCTRYRPEAARYELTTDVHSPERFRVIGPFSNMPEFAADFNCPVGSYMNPEHKCGVL